MNTKVFYALCIIISLFVLFCISYTVYNISNQIKNNQTIVSLPEEIKQAQEGDTLIVEKVSDSIYIGFKH